ncbi:hypothetical protein [Deinococcus sp.]|uniref:hypothetical protein n=1 Tax=Deinococcus sp. TaxID=47478 RepID=UPI0025F6DD56|nr:hypothetical protein [Deinococcus sp.]
MRFVHKPRPYSSGPFDGLRPGKPDELRRPGGRSRRPGPRRTRPARTPTTLWGGRAVDALAALGLIVTLLIGGAALHNQLTREAQFAAVGQAISGLGR